jgi:hypothetical protein
MSTQGGPLLNFTCEVCTISTWWLDQHLGSRHLGCVMSWAFVCLEACE